MIYPNNRIWCTRLSAHRPHRFATLTLRYGEILSDVAARARRYGKLNHCVALRNKIYLEYDAVEMAAQAAQDLLGRLFMGRHLLTSYLKLEVGRICLFLFSFLATVIFLILFLLLLLLYLLIN